MCRITDPNANLWSVYCWFIASNYFLLDWRSKFNSVQIRKFNHLNSRHNSVQTEMIDSRKEILNQLGFVSSIRRNFATIDRFILNMFSASATRPSSKQLIENQHRLSIILGHCANHTINITLRTWNKHEHKANETIAL